MGHYVVSIKSHLGVPQSKTAGYGALMGFGGVRGLILYMEARFLSQSTMRASVRVAQGDKTSCKPLKGIQVYKHGCIVADRPQR